MLWEDLAVKDLAVKVRIFSEGFDCNVEGYFEGTWRDFAVM